MSCGPSGYFREVDDPPPYVTLESLLTDFEYVPMQEDEFIVIKNRHFNCARLTPLGIGENPNPDEPYAELEFDIGPDGRARYYDLRSFSEETMDKDAAQSVRQSVGLMLNRYRPLREISNDEVRRTSRFFYVHQQEDLCQLADRCKLRSFAPGRSNMTFHCKGMKKLERFSGVEFPVRVDGYYRSNFKEDVNGVSMSYLSRSEIGFQEIDIKVGIASSSRGGDSDVYLNEILDESHLQYFVENGDGKEIEDRRWNYEIRNAQDGRVTIYHFTDKSLIGTLWVGLLDKYVVQINTRYSDHYRMTMQGLMTNEDAPFFLKDAGLTASVKLVESLQLAELGAKPE